MKTHSILLILLFIFSMNTSFSQELDNLKIDSVQNEIRETISKEEKADLYYLLTEYYADYYPDSIIKYGYKALTIYNNTEGNEENVIDVKNRLGIAFLKVDMRKAKLLLEESLEQAKRIKNDSLINLNYLALSAYYMESTNIDSSTHYSILATEYYKKTNDSIALSYCYFSIMSSFYIMKNYEKTVEYGELTYEIAKAKNIEHILGPITIALAHTYYNVEGKEGLAKEYVLKAEKIAISNGNDHLLLQVNLTKGVNEYDNNAFIQSIESYEKALLLSQALKDTFYIASCYYHLGLANFKIFKNDKAIIYFEKTIHLNNLSTDVIKRSYLCLSIINARINPEKQDFYLYKYDSITLVESKIKTEELLLKYESSEKEREIEILKTKKVEDELIIQKNKSKIVLIVSILVLTILLFLLFVYRYKNKQKVLKHEIEIEKHRVQQSKLELEQNKRELELKIDLLKDKNGLIEELIDKVKETSKDEVYIETIIKSLDQNYVSDKHWNNIIHHFSTLHKEHIKELKEKNNNITRNDIKLSILIKLGYTNSGMAEVLNITIEGVKKAKQRLKKKVLLS